MRRLELRTPSVDVETRPDGSFVIRSGDKLEGFGARASDAFMSWVKREPVRPAMADRRGPGGEWRRVSYGELGEMTGQLGQAFLKEGLSQDFPILLLSENRIEAAAITYAAYRSGIPVAPVTPAYAAANSDPARLRMIVETLRPGLIVVENAAASSRALSEAAPQTPVLSIERAPGARALSELLACKPGLELERAEAAIKPDATAKILFTSGSTGTPKGAINTHRMISANGQAIQQVWPFLNVEAPVLVDWLPWNHTFGGNFVLNSVLSSGGELYIDDGRPIAGGIARSVQNAAEVRPTIHLNAPRGLDMVARELARDKALANAFFERLGLVFFASAGLPPRIRGAWMDLITRHSRRPVAFCSAWGMTETAPLSTSLNFEAPEINNIGTPIPGTEIKLAPADGRFELRVRGPNVTPGYLNRPDLSSGVFDEEGFLRTGDAGRLADPANPELGLLIEGRLAEDFKLATGVWVAVTGLRAQILEMLGPMARDVVVSGPNRDELSLLVFLDIDQCELLAGAKMSCADLSAHGAIAEHVEAAVARYNHGNGGSSRKIARWKIMPRPLEAAAGELTEKGTVNQAVVLKRESSALDVLHA